MKIEKSASSFSVLSFRHHIKLSFNIQHVSHLGARTPALSLAQQGQFEHAAVVVALY